MLLTRINIPRISQPSSDFFQIFQDFFFRVVSRRSGKIATFLFPGYYKRPFFFRFLYALLFLTRLFGLPPSVSAVSYFRLSRQKANVFPRSFFARCVEFANALPGDPFVDRVFSVSFARFFLRRFCEIARSPFRSLSLITIATFPATLRARRFLRHFSSKRQKAPQMLDKPSHSSLISGPFFQNSSLIFDNMQLSQLDNIFFTILIKIIDRTTPTIDKNLSTTGPNVGLSVRRRGDRGLRRGFPLSYATDASSASVCSRRFDAKRFGVVEAKRRTRRLTRQRKGILKRVLFNIPQT